MFDFITIGAIVTSFLITIFEEEMVSKRSLLIWQVIALMWATTAILKG